MIAQLMNRVGLTILLLSSPLAFAGKIAKMDGKKVMINLEGDAAKPGDIFVVWDPNGKKKALVKIKQVRNDRAIGILGKGVAQPGWTIKISDRQGKPKKNVAKSEESGPKGRPMWGFMGGIVQDSVSVKIDDNNNAADGRETTVSMSGMGFSGKGVFDYNLFNFVWFRGMVGLEGFSAKAGGARTGCGGKACSVDIYYLSADLWGRAVYAMGDSKVWAGAGFTVMFPATKSATAIEESSITNTSAISAGGGFDWAFSPTMTIPVQIEYGLFPKSETVTASAIAFRAGLLMPF